MLDDWNLKISSIERAGKKSAGLSPDAKALKCAFPQLILALSLSRKSSVNKLLFVSTTRYSLSPSGLSIKTAQSGLYGPRGVDILNQAGSLA